MNVQFLDQDFTLPATLLEELALLVLAAVLCFCCCLLMERR